MSRWDGTDVELAELVGKTFTAVEKSDADSELRFVAADGSEYLMLHDQDCCESVYIESIAGDLADLVGAPILFAEVASSYANVKPEIGDDSRTWTFYKFATAKGWVDIRWFGSSNGYYSESVSFVRTKGAA
jgi:hypothetical protein